MTFILNEKRPTFSVIMPCYNSAEYVERAIRSCINQGYESWELIAVNDGSTDQTLDILNEYASEDRRIRVFSKENGGYVSAVNFGLEKIQGLYFLMLGSDDELEPTLFSELEKTFNYDSLPDIIGFRTTIQKSDGSKADDKYSTFSGFTFEEKTTIKEFAEKHSKESSIFFTRDTSKVFKTDVLGSLRYLGRKGMDADGIFSMMFSHKSKSFSCIPVKGYIWYLREASLSGRKKDFITQEDRVNTWIEFGNELLNLEPDCITPQEKYYITNYFYGIVESIYFSNFILSGKNNVLKKVICFFNIFFKSIEDCKINKELKFMLNHPILWQCFVIPKVFLKKLKKRL